MRQVGGDKRIYKLKYMFKNSTEKTSHSVNNHCVCSIPEHVPFFPTVKMNAVV